MSSVCGAGRLVIVGGGEDRPGEILREFVRLAGGRESRIVLMTTASEEHERWERAYSEAFGQLGAGDVRCPRVDLPGDAASDETLRLLDEATGVFFSGGSQKRLVDLLRGTKLHATLHDRLGDGLVIGGTSAGASMMAEVMLLEGESEESPRASGIELGPGMGFLPGAIIDQHFAQRGRIGRLLAALARRPEELGIGIDENTAMIVSQGRFEVIGRGSVMVLDAFKHSHNDCRSCNPDEPLTVCGVTLHCLSSGFHFDLATRTPIERPRSSAA